MKSEINTSQITAFFKANPFMKSIIIQAKNKIMFYPELLTEKKAFFKQIIDECLASYPANSDYFIITDKEYICISKRKQDIYICEALNHVSVSQVKLEFDSFIGDQQKQGKFSKFFTSFFDR